MKGIFLKISEFLFIGKIGNGRYSKTNNQKLIFGSIKMGPGSRLGFGINQTAEWVGYRKNYLKNTGAISIGSNSTITKGFRILCTGQFVMGDNTYINPNCELRISHQLTIGSNCSISWGLKIIDDDSHKLTSSVKSFDAIHIGDHVWIGMNVTILKGVTVGDNSVIAAGSIVTHNVPANVVVGGSPARVIKTNVNWE